MAVNLTGNYRGTDEAVSFYDRPVTIESKVALKQTHGYNLIRNPNHKGIDTIHTDRRGGNENEAGKWVGHYLEQPCINFNQFTLPFPTYNIPQERKEKYAYPSFPCFDKNGNPYIHYEPDYEFNTFSRFNSNFTQFWHINFSVVRDLNKLVRGLWKTNTVTAGRPEHWLCFKIGDVDLFNKNEKGIYLPDYSYNIGTEKYEKLIEKYTKEYNEYHKNIESIRKSNMARRARELHARKNQESKDILSEQV
jgi:hypothetical protein